MGGREKSYLTGTKLERAIEEGKNLATDPEERKVEREKDTELSRSRAGSGEEKRTVKANPWKYNRKREETTRPSPFRRRNQTEVEKKFLAQKEAGMQK